MRAVRDGTVISPVSTGDFGTLNEWLRLGSVSYVHVRAGRERKGDVGAVPGFVGTYDDAGKLTRVRVRRGTHYSTGDVIATVNGFNHVHLNVGWPGEEVNPLRLRLSQFSDTIAPTIAARGVHFFGEDWMPVPRVRGKAATVSGRVRIVVDAGDQADGNRPNRRRVSTRSATKCCCPTVRQRLDSSERPIGSSSIGLRSSPTPHGSCMRPGAAFLFMVGGERGSSMS